MEILLNGGAQVNIINKWMETPLHVALQVLISKSDRTINDFERVKKILQILLKQIGQSSQDCHELLSWKDTKGITSCNKSVETWTHFQKFMIYRPKYIRV